MKVTEISGGVAATLRIRRVGEPFPRVPTREEVSFVRTEDEILLQAADDVWAIEGITPAESARLDDVVLSGLPVLAYVAQGSSDALVIETRRFTQELRVTAPMQIGLDDKVMDDIRSVHGVGGTATDVGVWLDDRLLLPAGPGGPSELRRIVVSGDAGGRLDSFRIHGLKVSADVSRVGDCLQIERVVRGGNRDGRRLMLLFAPVSIVDATAAAALHGAVRTTLSEAVSGSGSYMRTWQTYQEMEREILARRARTFGALEYRKCERRRDRGWRFSLAPLDDLLARLALLGDWDRFELEAGVQAPSAAAGTPAAAPKSKKAPTRPLSASIANIDAEKGLVDLAALDEDEDDREPPTTGVLYLSTAGDETRLRRREEAELALRTGNCPLPQLGLLMEGRPAPAARRRRVSVHGPVLKKVIREVFGASKPTQRQLEAIEIAVNTPDICLIQGPPGTGKTRVITAIERCLAELAEAGTEPSHRILICAAQHDAVETVAQRTEVFGLPAVKVGRKRRGSDSSVDPADLFVAERAERLRALLQVPLEAERLSRARNIAIACVRGQALPAERAGRLRELARVLDGLLPPGLRDKALARASALERPHGQGDPEETEVLVRAARGIRIDPSAFSDDGPVKARIALKRLDATLTAEERRFLTRCVGVDSGTVPPWLEEGRGLRDALIDRLTQPAPVAQPGQDEATQELVLRILDAVNRRMLASRTGSDAAVSAYLDDLENDPEGVRQALEHYTVVLAATLQQAAGKEMRRVLGIHEGGTTFESVIVDEAARANPLDLFIPLSMARRRVILVGDHRQLPHLLEPDVERQLAEGVDQGSVEEQTLRAVQASLFERLWMLLRALEERDGIPRTVTLDAQYRMHPALGAYVSREFYEVHDDGEIQSPRPAEQFAHDLPGYVDQRGPQAAAWHDVPAARGAEVRGVSKRRPAEARAIAGEVRRLMAHDPTLTFGVIAFYSAQVDEIGRAMLKTGLTEPTKGGRGWRVSDGWASTYDRAGKQVERLRIGTVDAFQGKEFDVVFLSVTRSNDLPGRTDEEQRRKYGHLMLANRLCVAMSRQQRLLVAVGDKAFVRAELAQKPLRALRAFTELCGGSSGLVL